MTPSPSIVRERVRCALCGADQTRIRFRVDISNKTTLSRIWIGNTSYDLNGRETLVQCLRCGLVYVNPRVASQPGMAPYSLAQELAYFTNTRDARLRAYHEFWERVPGWLGHQPASMLDIGCGDGVLMEIAQAGGAAVDGLDVSAPMIAAAQQRLGSGAVFVSQLSQVPRVSYEVVTLINVLEHVPHPLQMMQAVARLVVPGGLVLVHVPNLGGVPARLAGARWHQIEPLAHYYYFTRQTLSRLLVQCGFQVTGRFNLIIGGRWLGGLQRLAGELGLYFDSGLGLVARRRTD